MAELFLEGLEEIEKLELGAGPPWKYTYYYLIIERLPPKCTANVITEKSFEEVKKKARKIVEIKDEYRFIYLGAVHVETTRADLVMGVNKTMISNARFLEPKLKEGIEKLVTFDFSEKSDAAHLFRDMEEYVSKNVKSLPDAEKCRPILEDSSLLPFLRIAGRRCPHGFLFRYLLLLGFLDRINRTVENLREIYVAFKKNHNRMITMCRSEFKKYEFSKKEDGIFYLVAENGKLHGVPRETYEKLLREEKWKMPTKIMTEELAALRIDGEKRDYLFLPGGLVWYFAFRVLDICKFVTKMKLTPHEVSYLRTFFKTEVIPKILKPIADFAKYEFEDVPEPAANDIRGAEFLCKFFRFATEDFYMSAFQACERILTEFSQIADLASKVFGVART